MEKQLPIEKLLYEEEGTTLDFKKEEYKFCAANDYEKSELLKDILAFSNAWRRVDAYILIGVEEIKGGRSKIVGIRDELDDAQLQQFINSKTQRPIEFSYRTVMVDTVKIGVLRIPVQTRPFYLEKDYGKLKRHVVYIRRGSSTDEATPEEVRNMGRSEIQETQEIPALSFEFAHLETRSSLGIKLNLEAKLLDIPPIKEIPDYINKNDYGPFGITLSLNKANSSYNRDLVKYYYALNKTSELAFLLKNDSTKAISDIRVELIVEKLDDRFSFAETSKFPAYPESHYDAFRNMRSIDKQIEKTNKRSIEIKDLGNFYRIEIPFEKVQPKQTVFSLKSIMLFSNDSFSVKASVTIYADNVPVPIKQELEISCIVSRGDGSLMNINELHRKHVLLKYPIYKN